MYKRRNNDILYTGPVWDMDLAFENDVRTYPIDKLPNWIYRTSGSAATGMKTFVNRLFDDPAFFAEMKEIYASYRNSGVISEEELLKVVDDYAAELDQSQKLNFMRWDIMNVKVHQNPVVHGSYGAEVENVKSYISNRIKKIDTMLGYVPTSSEYVNESKIIIRNEGGNIYVDGLSGNATIYVYDQLGRIVYLGNAHNSFEKYFGKGFYIVTVVENNNMAKVSKVAIME